MRSFPALSACAFLACGFLPAVSAASADSRVFIVANQADGYGIDECLARGEKCGAYAARSYCQSREFASASAYRRIDPDELHGSRVRRVRRHYLRALKAILPSNQGGGCHMRAPETT
jgi:hypothetical protein